MNNQMATRWALLRLIGRRHADAEPLAQGSDGQREFVERDRHRWFTGSSLARS